MRVVGFLLLWSWAVAGLAQATQAPPTMYKCLDAQRRVTYSNITCEKQGLQDAGPVADRVTSMPFTEPPKPAARKDADKAPAPKAQEEGEVSRGGAQLKPVNPLIEKLTK